MYTESKSTEEQIRFMQQEINNLNLKLEAMARHLNIYLTAECKTTHYDVKDCSTNTARALLNEDKCIGGLQNYN